MNIYFCIKDYEEAIDEFVDRYESFPILEKDTNNICKYCGAKSEYVVKLPESKSNYKGYKK